MEYLDKFFDKNNYNIERINNLIYGDYYFADHLYFYGPGIYYFTKKDITVSSFASLHLNLDSEFANVDPNYILEISSTLEVKNADALFISCTALPVLNIIHKLEKIIRKPVLSSNQTLIWDTLRSIGYNSPIQGYGKLLEN